MEGEARPWPGTGGAHRQRFSISGDHLDALASLAARHGLTRELEALGVEVAPLGPETIDDEGLPPHPIATRADDVPWDRKADPAGKMPEGADEERLHQLWLVQWPQLRASLVSAASEEDLLEVLSNGDAAPAACRYQRYGGPVFVDFLLSAEVGSRDSWPRSLAALRTGDLYDLQDGTTMLRVEPEDGAVCVDDGPTLHGSIMSFAFPHLARAWETAVDEAMARDRSAEIPLDVVKSALKQECARYVAYGRAPAAYEKQIRAIQRRVRRSRA